MNREVAVLILFLLNVGRLRGSEISEIFQLRRTKCVVALLDSGSVTMADFWTHLEDDFKPVNHDVALRRYHPPFVWDDGVDLAGGSCAADSCQSSVVIFRRSEEDYSCLHDLPPLLHDWPTAVWDDRLLLNDHQFLHFINSNCLTHYNPDGSLDETGVKKAALESSLSPHTSSTVGDILRTHNSMKLTDAAPDLPTCEEVTSLSANSLLQHYLLASKPVVIRGAAGDWPARTKWSPEYLRSAVPENRTVHVKIAPGGQFEGVERRDEWEDWTTNHIPPSILAKLPYPDLVTVRPATANPTFAQFLDTIQSRELRRFNASAYLEYSSMREKLAELLVDVREPCNVSHWLRLDSTNIWISDGDTLGKLHFDPYDNILAMVKGRKELILFDPFNNENLYESHIQEANLKFDLDAGKFIRRGLQDTTSIVMSPVNISNMNLERFPLFARARPVRCVIGEGDALLLPAFWWHEVQSSPASPDQLINIAVNFWYHPLFSKPFPCSACGLRYNNMYDNLLQTL